MNVDEGTAIEPTQGAEIPGAFAASASPKESKLDASRKALDAALKSKSGLRKKIFGWWVAIIISYLAAFILDFALLSYLPSLLLIASRFRIPFISGVMAIFAAILFILSIAPLVWFASLFAGDTGLSANANSVLGALSAGCWLMFLATLAISDFITFKEDPRFE